MEVPTESFHRSSWDSRTCYPWRDNRGFTIWSPLITEEFHGDLGEYSLGLKILPSDNGPGVEKMEEINEETTVGPDDKQKISKSLTCGTSMRLTMDLE